MPGVNKRTDGLWVSFGAACFGCGNGDECSSGRKVRSVRSGVNRRVLRRSESVSGAIVDNGAVGYDCDGMMIRDRNVRLCDRAP
jgi:hypothetical protein